MTDNKNISAKDKTSFAEFFLFSERTGRYFNDFLYESISAVTSE